MKVLKRKPGENWELIDKEVGGEQTTVRLTLRMPEKLDEMLRAEVRRRGTSINQTMLYILTKKFYSSDNAMTPDSFS